ncbi:hypothetical protein SEA_ROBINROSE_4 [Microbacterium phage RobinRose]|nr:hypothetical protein SEA_ROBINROSE_4 [Microbacterium phage RobinRose]
MKFTLGFLAGLSTAWAALAIWQHRAIPDVDPADVPGVVPTSELIDPAAPPLRTDQIDSSTDMRCNFEWKSLSMGRVQCSRRYPGHGPRHTHGAAWITVGSETMPLIEGRWLQ